MNEDHLLSLIQRWRMFALFSVISIVVGGIALVTLWKLEYAVRWMLLAGSVLIYQHIYVYRRLEMNHRLASAAILPSLGFGTILTILRGMMIAWTAGFMLSPRPPGPLSWIPPVLYTTAIALDILDGYAARAQDHQTRLGEDLDNELDSLGLLVAISLAVSYGSLPPWFLPIGLARYAFRLGIWIRERNGMPVHPLTESQSRRPIAGLTMGFTSAMLWPIVSPPGTTMAGVLFLVPFSASFTRDWLVVSGTVDPSSPGYMRKRTLYRNILLNWIPLGLRVTLLFMLLMSLAGGSRMFEGPNVFASSSPGFPFVVLGLVLIIAGFAGRICSFLLVFPISFAIINQGIHPDLVILLIMDLTFLILGTGAFSLWAPEGNFFGRRWGANED